MLLTMINWRYHWPNAIKCSFHIMRIIIKTMWVCCIFPYFLFISKNIIWHDLIHIMKFYVNSKNISKKNGDEFLLLLLLHFATFLRKNANLAEVLLACWLNTYTMWVWDGLGRVWHIKKKRWYGKECKKSSRQKGRYLVYSHFGA